ncbi:hypothetical protein K4L06_01980 [Lysobacter sp. BMK333-48F3]|uniref:hypothetical protein n=1 Tax=Lysobacter sp. BMK333-48F3 TaxID=2867962 RepID=UPI001C8B46C2|nr:hypothetical protein [Lysobacter sp. BMK333-48F3]MBX9400062.1 hypothetical protein [Lysobacter sp. BMK333-48F3]
MRHSAPKRGLFTLESERAGGVCAGFNIALALAIGVVSSGCGAVRSIAGINTVQLRDAQVSAMEADIGPGVATICPRQPVQMHVAVSARLGRESAPSEYETWHGGNGTRRNGMLDFRNFAFSSAQGRFDELGWYTPDPDVLVSVDSGFAISTRLLHPRAQLAQSRHYPADYGCIVSVGTPGGPGQRGRDGSSGYDGRDGRSGVDGEQGDHGRDGGGGELGGPGYEGPRLRMYATYVSTRSHPKLIAVRVTGDFDDFVLAPADRPLTLVAAGGIGGAGGNGGNGGRGGDGGRGEGVRDQGGKRHFDSGGNGGSGGDGGDGGDGAPGGVGGSGGRIELTYDRRYPELAQWLRFDVAGGPGGAGGGSGSAGSQGSGGSANGGHSGRSGRHGFSGRSGPTGAPGRPGQAEANAGEVGAYFSGLPGVRPL